MPALTSHGIFKEAISEMSATVPQPSQEKIWKCPGVRGGSRETFDRLRRAGLTFNYWRVLPKPVKFSVFGITDRMIILNLIL